MHELSQCILQKVKNQMADVASEETSRYDRYVEEVCEDIAATIQQFGCQPILFVGSGLPKRYIGAPNWGELLAHLAEECTSIEKGLGFYNQLYKSPMLIAEEFARLYQEWAWGQGHNEFPEEMFGDKIGSQAYLKFKIASYLQSLTPDDICNSENKPYWEEIESLKRIKPHAVITTNYDRMLELIFPDHEPIVGQRILKGQSFTIGEIYKIHGCVTEFESIVFTQTDYDTFIKKKKFLTAKLLTFFNEHPLIFIGYNAGDPNIRSILSDIDLALPEKGGVVPNVYILQWNSNLDKDSSPPREKLIPTEEDRSVRVKLIEASDFGWVFDAFASNPALNDVNPRVLRALIARSYELVRHDIPKMKVEADFKMLTNSVTDSNTFATLFGIANIDNYSVVAAQHPFSATQLGKLLGGNGWHHANALLERVRTEKGVDLKTSDNRYHRADMVNTTKFHKYSQESVDLLTKVGNGDAYTVTI